MSAAAAKLLVVEDQADLREALRANLAFEGHAVRAVGTAAQALAELHRDPPDLTVLDLMLPDMDGFRVLRSARRAGYRGAVLVLSARGQESDKVNALDSGADDYVTKPFGLLELLARIAALLRRTLADGTDLGPVRLGDVEIDARSRTARRAGKPVSLSPKEFDLLLCLVRRQGAAVSRQELLASVWGHAGTVETRTVDTHVAELRRKLESDPARPRRLLTVRKVGYRLCWEGEGVGPAEAE